ncbi:hypothetical protein G7054_g14930 [Neopestalotiopsis clavispora]|nr:hypothetical protein G7054_g14930 [Neopestalotiopsis clavispora]
MFAPERSLNPESFASKLKTRQKANGLVQPSAPRDLTAVQVAGVRTANETTITSPGVQSTARISRNPETAGTAEVVLATSVFRKEQLTRKGRHRPLLEQTHLAGRSSQNLGLSSPQSTIPSLEGPWNGTEELTRASPLRSLVSSRGTSNKRDAGSRYAERASARIATCTLQDGAGHSQRNSPDVSRCTSCFLCETDVRSATKHQCVECPQIVYCSVCLPNASHTHPNHQFHCLPASGSDFGSQNTESESAKSSPPKSNTRAETLPGASVMMKNTPITHIDREVSTYRCNWCEKRLSHWRYECQQCPGHVSFCAKHQNNHYSLHTINSVALDTETIPSSEAMDTVTDATNLADSLPKEQELSAVIDGSSLDPFVSSTDGTRQDGVISLSDEGQTHQGRARSPDEYSPSFGSEDDGSPRGEVPLEAASITGDIVRVNESGVESVLSESSDTYNNCSSNTAANQSTPRAVQYDSLILSVCTSIIDAITKSADVLMDQDVRHEVEEAVDHVLHQALYGSAEIRPLSQLVDVRTARKRRSLLDFSIDPKTKRTNPTVTQRHNGPRRAWLRTEQRLLKKMKRRGWSEKEIGKKLKRSAAAVAQQWRRQNAGSLPL